MQRTFLNVSYVHSQQEGVYEKVERTRECDAIATRFRHNMGIGIESDGIVVVTWNSPKYHSCSLFAYDSRPSNLLWYADTAAEVGKSSCFPSSSMTLSGFKEVTVSGRPKISCCREVSKEKKN